MSLFAEFWGIVYNTFTPIFLIAGGALLLGRRFEMDPRTLARANVYLFVPSLILNSLLNSELSAGEIGRIVGAVALCDLVMASLAFIVGRSLRLPRQLLGTFVATAFIMNGLNFGLPFIEFAFGTEAIDRAIAFNIGQVFMVYTVGTFVVSSGTLPLRDSLLRVLRLPLLYAFVLGVLSNATEIALPDPLLRAIDVLGSAVVPCALVILGLQLGRASLQGQWKPLWAITGMRFVLAPLAMFGATLLFGLTGLTSQVLLVQYSMPVGVANTVLATEFDGDTQYAAAAVLFTTLFSIIPLSLLLFIT